MPISKLSIQEFLAASAGHLVLDVRSPAEYQQAHIPGAVSLPLFNDEERKKIGTAYKQQSREQAIKFGLDFFGPNMRRMVEQVESLLSQYKNNTKLFLHCWRGGMRSGAVAWLLNFYGFEVYLLDGGYKVYRNWVLAQFENEYDLRILGGYTGSGKTPLLHQLQKEGQVIIDLEGIANHKGSAFGALGQPLQPRQEMFENLLATALHEITMKPGPIWIEDESQRIGVLNIPHPFWDTMRTKPVYFLDIPFEERLAYITGEYGIHDKENLVNAITRIQKRLGPVETTSAINYLLEDNFTESFRILLTYYDKHYGKALYNRENITALLNKIPCSAVDTTTNTQRILTCEPASSS